MMVILEYKEELSISRYIRVKSSLNKIIKIDSDNIDEAIEIAKDDFSELELTSEWLNDREVTFEEEKNITKLGKELAKLYSTRSDRYESFDDIKKFIDMVFKDPNIADYVYEETIISLKEDYNICPSNINI